MIARLEGRLLETDGTRVLLDVGGVGYELEITTGLLGRPLQIGEALVLFVHQVVREDGHFLFGFALRAEREMFRALIRVNGVGPKLAMALLSGLPLAALASALANEDVARLTRISGVGRKTAERLIVELRDKLGALATLGTAPLPAGTRPALRRQADDAEAALIALGYRPVEATRWVAGVLREEGNVLRDERNALREERNVLGEELSVEEIVRLALRAAGEAR